MAKYENSTTPGQTKPSLDQDGQALVAALTAAILAARENAPLPNQVASDAAEEYAGIKAALRTHSEKLRVQAAQQS